MTHYQISRNGQMYGPYTLEDLQRYVASGNVLPSDLAKSDEMTDWVVVSQLLASSGSQPGQPLGASPAFSTSEYTAPAVAQPGFSTPGYANPAGFAYPGQAAFNAGQYPDAPNLNWGVLLLIDFFTCGLFEYIWNIIVAAWLRRVQPNATSLFFYIGVVLLALVNIAVALPAQLAAAHALQTGTSPSHLHTNYAGALIGLLTFAVKIVARFSQRASLEEHFNTVENVGLRLNPVMTFFFGGLYFQYHLNKINGYKQALRLNQPGGQYTPPAAY